MCDVDFDCAVGKYCVPGEVSWSPTNGTDFCSCNLFFGWLPDESTGECTERNGTFSFLMFVVAVELMVAIAMFLLGAEDIRRYVTTFRLWKVTAATITMVSTTLGLLFFIMWRSLFTASARSPEEFDVRLSDDADAEKFAGSSVEMRPAVALTIMFILVSSLNVSILWLEISFRTKAMKTRGINSITYYRRAVFALESVVALLVLIIAILGAWNLSIVVLLPFIVIVLVSFVLGRRRMIEILADAIEMSSGDKAAGNYSSDAAEAPPSPSLVKGAMTRAASFLSNSSANSKRVSTSLERTKKALKSIRRTSLHVITGLFLVVFSGIFYFLFDTEGIASPHGFKEFARPNFSSVTVFNTFLDISALYILTAIQLYSHRNLRTLVRRERQANVSQQSSGTNDLAAGPSSFVNTKDLEL